MISFEYVDSYAKTFLILYPPFENSTTRIAILPIMGIANTTTCRNDEFGSLPKALPKLVNIAMTIFSPYLDWGILTSSELQNGLFGISFALKSPR